MPVCAPERMRLDLSDVSAGQADETSSHGPP